MRVLLATVIVISSSIVLFDAAANSSRDRESQALTDFGWPFINSSVDHCKWNGMFCNADGRVAVISLECSEYSESWRFFNHTLDMFDVLAFPYLARIHLPSCGLFGKIPPNIGFLSNLTHLNLSQNGLTDHLPLSLANLTNLQLLDISSNRLFGAVPPQIGYLEHLVLLDLSNNGLNGSLPLTITQLRRLVFLKLGYNRFEDIFEAGLEIFRQAGFEFHIRTYTFFS